MDEQEKQPKERHQVKSAVALQYDRLKHQAPLVVATGKGLIAERILQIAREHDIPIRQDPDLIQVLSKLDLGEVIPSELYPVIAEIFAFVYRLNAEKAKPTG